MVLHHRNPQSHTCIQQSPLQRDSGEHLFCNTLPNSAFPSSRGKNGEKEAFSLHFFPCRNWIKAQHTSALSAQELQLIVFSSPEGRGKGQKQGSRCCFAFLSRCMNKTCLGSWSWHYSTHAIYSSGAPNAVASFSYLHITHLDIVFQPRAHIEPFTSTVEHCLY